MSNKVMKSRFWLRISNGSVGWALTSRHTDTHTYRTNCIPWTADVGGNDSATLKSEVSSWLLSSNIMIIRNQFIIFFLAVKAASITVF